MKIADLVTFRKDLFFGGAVQIDWFEKATEKSHKAASNFVFHGPRYFGVGDSDKAIGRDYSLKDTVTLTAEILNQLDPEKENSEPIALAIAAYGAGKSHFSLTLATLLSDYNAPVSRQILTNIEQADAEHGRALRQRLAEWSHPVLVLPINGMDNFDLSDELSRQVLVQLRRRNLDTGPIEDLWPRFRIAATFAERNFTLWREKFEEEFGQNTSIADILTALQDHNEICFKKINNIYHEATGAPIRTGGAESPKQLLDTLCQFYCGPNGPFQSVLILFDEFGRYLEFAVEKPHLAGDAALQQIFEGVHDNARFCFMLCTIQYELKTYVSRVSSEHQNTISRFVGRYDASTKYYMSSNQETLFAHLVEKKDAAAIAVEVAQGPSQDIQGHIEHWLPDVQLGAVWHDKKLFQQVIAEGCWPLHPLSTLLLCRLGDRLQKRSAVTYLADTIERKARQKVGAGATLPAVALFQPNKGDQCPLLQELISTEQYAATGSTAHAYAAVHERYGAHLAPLEQNTLLAILITDKMGLKVNNQEEAHQLFALLAGAAELSLRRAVDKLCQEYGVLAWDEKFKRYDIFSDATSRNEFLHFLQRKVKAISALQAASLFARNIDKLGVISDVETGFAAKKAIHTLEWQCQHYFSNQELVDGDIRRALTAWQEAIEPHKSKGQMIYCYLPANTKVAAYQDALHKRLQQAMKAAGIAAAPVLIVLLHDHDETIRESLSAHEVLENMSDREKQKFQAFISSQHQRLIADLTQAVTSAFQALHIVLPCALKPAPTELRGAIYGMFDTIYHTLAPFPFDGFQKQRSIAAQKECREITIELFKGTMNHEWFTTKPRPLQNRFREVLINKWEAINDDGRARLTPRQPVLKQIIRAFDNTLKTNQTLNLGDMFNSLVSPPFGFNAASAGLVMGLFLCARMENIALLINHKSVSVAVWVNAAMPKNFVERKVLEMTTLQYIETDEWHTLIGQWAEAQTHLDQRRFYEKAAELEQRIPQPASEVLTERLKRLKDRAAEAISALAAFDNFIEKRDIFYLKGVESEDIALLSRSGKELKEKENTCNQQKHLWTEEQIDAIVKRVQKFSDTITDFFPGWLKQISCIHYSRIDSFRDSMIKYTAANLKTLKLAPLAAQLEKRTHEIINDMEERQRVFYIVDATRTFLKTTEVTEQTPITTLAEWMDKIDQHLSELLKAGKIRDVPDIKNSTEALNALRVRCQEMEKRQWDRHTELMDRSFSTVEELKTLLLDVRAAIPVFYKQDIELKDLETLMQRLERCQADFIAWSDPNISVDQLATFVGARIEEIAKLPEWEDAPDIYRRLQQILIDEKTRRSTEWMQSIQIAKAVAKMNTEECHRLLAHLHAAPVFITPDDRKTVAELRKKVETRLEQIGIESHIVWFQNQPYRVQKVFVDTVVQLFEQDSRSVPA